jgi:DHA2 family multidrug resistance protein
VLSYRNSETVHSRLVDGLRPDNPIVATMPSSFSLTDPTGLAVLGRTVQRQAMMVSMADSFWFLAVLTMFASILLLFIRAPGKGAAEAAPIPIE